MKNLYIIIFISALLAGCDNFEEDINKDPNNPSEASAGQLIANAQIALQGTSHNLSGQFLAQYLAEVEYQDASLYPVTTTSFYGFYEDPLMNLQLVLDESQGTTNQQAVAQILKGYYFWHMTDRWGDIPYTGALKGAENLTPEYNTQQDIYNNIFTSLKDATEQMDGLNISDDIIYDGDPEKWKKLSNSIRLLMALRLSEVDEATAKAQLTAALNAGVMDSNDDSFIFDHLADANHQSYWFSQIDPVLGRGREWWAVSETLVEQMKPVNDPRLSVFARTNANDEYIGLPFGTEGVVEASTVSLLGTELWEQDAPVYLITYPQVLFALAEAAKRGWISGGDVEAETYYNMAIENSLLQWTGSTDGLADLLAEPDIAYAPATALEQIATQRYVHLFMNGYEAWAEWRRTGYPDNLVAPNGRAVPTRQMYVETEQFNNEENYKEAVSRQFGGQESLYDHVWWDKP